MEPERRPYTFSSRDPSWLASALASLRYAGFAIVTDVLGGDTLGDLRTRMYAVQERLVADVGHDRLARAGEHGVLRLMLGYDLRFAELLAVPELLALVDATVSDTAILHLQNGFILPTMSREDVERSFQTTFHRDFPRYLDGYLASLNVMVAVDEFREDNGATLLVPGSHQRPEAPDVEYMRAAAVAGTCPAGSLLVFDSTLWHAAGANVSGEDRLAINHQFSRSWIKQQIDYVRALGDEAVLSLPPRTQQLLGWYTRVVTSLDEFYRPAEERLYRSGQG